jgi:MFS family permease
MLVTVMQIVDTSVTNVALPHMQGSLSASVDEIAWVLTSYLAANAVIIPATGWLSAGRACRRRWSSAPADQRSRSRARTSSQACRWSKNSSA